MIGGLKTVILAWVNKIAVIGGTWLFVYESALTYEGRMNAVPSRQIEHNEQKCLRHQSQCWVQQSDYWLWLLGRHHPHFFLRPYCIFVHNIM